MSPKTVYQIFEIVFQIGDINMLAFRGAFLKSSFSDEKNIGGEIRDTL